MRSLFVVGWLCLGLAGLIYHLGPGVELRAKDRADQLARMAAEEATSGKWKLAVDNFDEALLSLPDGCDSVARRLRLEKAKVQMMSAQLPEAHDALPSLLAEIKSEEPSNFKLINETQSVLASSQYYMTWLMRLEGLTKDEWGPEIEAARQNYRVVAQSAEALGDVELAHQRQEDLEAAIRLARLDLSELQALPLPSQ